MLCVAGNQVIVMPGVRIGNGANHIASGSVVTGHIPDYGIAWRQPGHAHPLRRYSDKDITRLLTLAWWDWPLQHITEHIRTINGWQHRRPCVSSGDGRMTTE